MSIELRALSVGYGETAVLRELNLTVSAGEFVGIIGPNGCGKTTTLRTLSGLLRPIAGEVFVDGEPLSRISARQRARKIACLPQDFHVEWSFTVRELVHMGRSPYLPTFGGETARDRELVERAMEQTGVLPLAERSIQQLSGGERQRVRLAICLAQEAKILLLDEPTNHLDPRHQLRLLDWVAAWRHRASAAVVSVLHDLNLVSEYCDRVVLLHDGVIQAAGCPQEVLTESLLSSVYGVDAHIEKNPISGRPHLFFSAGKSYHIP
ncbi:MAG: heme ABC transporter ATP-binding protein [Thermoguttaceae bacterium]|nr:heme ABC transporter ATP-binding protein [Thermoguttaceae bacterium]